MKVKRNYSHIAVPGDLFDDLERMGQYAIDVARERARLYCVPCIWTAERVHGDLGDYEIIFRVCRIRPKTQAVRVKP